MKEFYQNKQEKNKKERKPKKKKQRHISIPISKELPSFVALLTGRIHYKNYRKKPKKKQ